MIWEAILKIHDCHPVGWVLKIDRNTLEMGWLNTSTNTVTKPVMPLSFTTISYCVVCYRISEYALKLVLWICLCVDGFAVNVLKWWLRIFWYPFLSIPFTCYAFIFSQTKNALIKMWMARNLRFQNWLSDIFFWFVVRVPWNIRSNA